MSEINTKLEWDRPVHDNGTVSIPKPILKSLGNPAEIRFIVEGNLIVIKKVDPKNADLGKLGK
jgi:bifunctional DNA-binding transcriptional regulator/antitoxin component of YhaV-PrlF toxin-antitoxin module